MSLLHLAHAVAVGAFLTAATLLLDGALRGRGLPTRGLWILALVATVTAPFWGPRLSGVDPALGAAASPAAAAPYAPAEPAPRGAYSLRQRLRAATLQPLPALPLLWLALAGLTTGTVGIGLLRLERKARRWPRAMLAGEEVAVSPAFGPAVVGVHRPRTVVPAWVLGLARREIELIVAHERAHRAAGDAALLAGGLLLAALCPWNPFLWVQFRGLRDAVEMDCDRRLLRSGVSRPAYARVLVLVRLRGTAVGGATAALVESNSSLERRLRSMRMFPWSGRKTVLSAAAALTMGVLAC